MKPLFKIGDKVKIINPERIVRVGYPLSREMVKKTITSDELDTVAKLLGYSNNINLIHGSNQRILNAADKILDNIAYVRLVKQGFGGKERKLYTELLTEYKDKIGIIEAKKVVRTGNYYPAWSGHDSYTGEYDYEPGGLDNAKCHLILGLSFGDSFCWQVKTSYESQFWIEAKNVIRVSEFQIYGPSIIIS